MPRRGSRGPLRRVGRPSTWARTGGGSMVGLELLDRTQGDRLCPLDRLLLAARQLVQEVDGLVALPEQAPDEGMAGGRGEVGVALGPLGEVEPEVRLAVDAHAGHGNGAAGE